MHGISLGANRATFEAYESRVEARLMDEHLRSEPFWFNPEPEEPEPLAGIRCARCAMPADAARFWALADGTCCGMVPSIMWPGVIDHGTPPF